MSEAQPERQLKPEVASALEAVITEVTIEFLSLHRKEILKVAKRRLAARLRKQKK